jgi:type I restriction enzyme S subunit
MSDQPTRFSALARENLMEVGAGRPRSVLEQYPSIPILRVADVLDGGIESPVQDLAPVGYQTVIGAKISRPGDVVLTAKGTVGRVALMPPDGPAFAYSPQLCYFRPAADGPLRSRYLYYWFKSAQFWNQADALKGQTDMADYLSLSDVEQLEITIPPLIRQDGVIGILGALDDKIAANDSCGRTSSELASTLFEAAFESGELMNLARLGEMADVIDCLHSKKPEFVEGGRVYLVLADIRDDSRLNSSPSFTISESDYVEWTRRIEVREGDCVITNVGRVGAVAQVPHGMTAAIGRNMTAVRGRLDCPPAFLLEALRSSTVRSEIDAKADQGTIMNALNVRTIPDLVIPAGSVQARHVFQEKVGPLHRLQDQLLAENEHLMQVRDALLPKLMSGEIRVRDAEKVVEDVT